MNKIVIGISSCLLGLAVRYDGGHRLDLLLKDTLGQFADFIPVCPEYECGLGVPREPMRLEGDPDNPRLMTRQTRKDLTETMRAWSQKRVSELEAENLRGFIFKSSSPSCGMEGVKVYNDQGVPVQTGAGIFARAFMRHFPLLPVADEERLQDPGRREDFRERILALNRG